MTMQHRSDARSLALHRAIAQKLRTDPRLWEIPGRTPVILEHGGQPVAVVLSYEEFKTLQALKSDEEQRLTLGWWGLKRLLAAIHGRSSERNPEEIEAEITAARQEAKQLRHAGRRRR
jgi:hypothetical protein